MLYGTDSGAEHLQITAEVAHAAAGGNEQAVSLTTLEHILAAGDAACAVQNEDVK